MTYAVTMRDVPVATSYAGAVALFERAVPWRNGGDDRPLPNKRSRDYGVRMSGDDVVFRCYRTDVIRWKPDGSYEINTGGYGTRTTCEFANNFMPRGHYLLKSTQWLRIEGCTYPISGSRVSVSSEGCVSGDGLGEFQRRTIDRKAAKALLARVGYTEYAKWYASMAPLMGDQLAYKWQLRMITAHDAIAALQRQDQWHTLLMSQSGHPDQMRRMVYEYVGGVFTVTHEPHVTGPVPSAWTVVTRGA